MSEIASVYLLECLKSFRGLKSNAEKAMEQVTDQELHVQPDSESNSISVIVKHMAGNMRSRFTEFLTTDGEKPNRDRDAEFIDSFNSRDELMKDWNNGWNCVFETLQSLKAEDLDKTVFIRGEAHSVLRAIQRQLVHYAYHTGQIVYLCKHIRSESFTSLSIPRGQSSAFKSQPPSNQ